MSSLPVADHKEGGDCYVDQLLSFLPENSDKRHLLADILEANGFNTLAKLRVVEPRDLIAIGIHGMDNKVICGAVGDILAHEEGSGEPPDEASAHLLLMLFDWLPNSERGRKQRYLELFHRKSWNNPTALRALDPDDLKANGLPATDCILVMRRIFVIAPRV